MVRAGKKRKKDELREGKNLNIAMSRTAPPLIRPGKTDILEVSMSYLPGREIQSRNLNVGREFTVLERYS